MIISAGFISATFTKGDLEAEIETEYGENEILLGWINISLENEPADSLLSCFNSQIELMDFLESSGVDFQCVPEDCGDYYNAAAGNAVKSFSLNVLEEQIIGLKFQGELKDNPVKEISFKVDSTATANCFQPLKINILDDEEVNWYSFKSLDQFTCSVSKGCFNPAETLSEDNIGETRYCEKITVPPKPSFEVGAYIVQGTTANPEFKMDIYDVDEGFLGECILNVDSTGEKSCKISLNLTETLDVFVCLRADKITDYKIQREEVAPCGFYGLGSGSFTSDYYIFAKGNKYAPINSFVLDESEFGRQNTGSLKTYINNYLYDRFDNGCANGCIVPIKFSSGSNQQLTLSDLQLVYETTTGLKSESNFYDVGEGSAKINMDFTKLDLRHANFALPTADGDYTAKIYLGSGLVTEQDVSVYASLNITGLNSQEVPAATPYKFIVYTSSEEDIISYTWDFGDGTTKETAENEVTHTYSDIDDYDLQIEVEDALGKKAIRNFQIKAVNPQKFVELSLKIKKENLNDTIKELALISEWYKPEIEQIAALSAIGSELSRLEREYDLASTSEEYVDVMSELGKVKVPYSLQGHYSSGNFFLNARDIDPSYLIGLGAGEVKNPERYVDSIINWFDEYVEMKIESNIYYLYYGDETVPVLTYFKVKIIPKKDYEKENYFVLERSYDKITFKENYKEEATGFATGIVFSDLEVGNEEVIEFILPEKLEIIDLPVFMSAEFFELPETNTTVFPCDFNGICDGNLGETAENCPSDCRPWKRMLLYVAILLFAAFIVYILMQEWYKRFYEGRLFKNKTDLFNLISFINNALNQGFSKREIIKKLKASKWSGEQIIYAFKKRKGKRTGMWEIPLFRWFEKRKVKKEMAKRRTLGLGMPLPKKQPKSGFRRF
jgi:hypothetical protein